MRERNLTSHPGNEPTHVKWKLHKQRLFLSGFSLKFYSSVLSRIRTFEQETHALFGLKALSRYSLRKTSTLALKAGLFPNEGQKP